MVIFNDYLKKAVNLLEEVRDQSTDVKKAATKAYWTLACYASNQYQNITRRMTSAAYESKKTLLKNSKLELQKLKQMTVDKAQIQRHIRTLKAQNDEDEEELQTLQTDRNTFLCTAIENYLKCLEAGNDHDLYVFRLISLWFANYNDYTVNLTMMESSGKVASHKFLPLIYQLAARMSNSHDHFQQALQQLLLRLSLDHPYHTLSVLLALANASKDDELSTPSSGSTGTSKLSKKQSNSKKPSNSTIDKDKMLAAQQLLDKVQMQKPTLVQSIRLLSEAYIELAYYSVSHLRKQQHGMILHM